MNLSRLKQLAGIIVEAELRMGLDQAVLGELDACLRAAKSVLENDLVEFERIAQIAPLQADFQAKIERIEAILPRLRRLDEIKPKARVEVLDAALDAMDGGKLLMLNFAKIFVPSEQQRSLNENRSDVWRRCYACFKAVSVAN